MAWYFVDRIDSLEIGESARGVKAFTIDEDFFSDHFPGYPVVPGVVILEALAQLSGKLIGYTVYRERGHWPFPVVTMMQDVKFRRFVRPGDRVELISRIVNMREESCEVKVAAVVGGGGAVEARMFFVFNPSGLDSPKAERMVEENEKRHLKSLWKGDLD